MCGYRTRACRPIADADRFCQVQNANDPPAKSTELKRAISNRAIECGFDAVGFARAALGERASSRLSDWLDRGCHGDMDWIVAKSDRRQDPKILWPEARSVIVCAVNYGPGGKSISSA